MARATRNGSMLRLLQVRVRSPHVTVRCQVRGAADQFDLTRVKLTRRVRNQIKWFDLTLKSKSNQMRLANLESNHLTLESKSKVKIKIKIKSKSQKSNQMSHLTLTLTLTLTFDFDFKVKWFDSRFAEGIWFDFDLKVKSNHLIWFLGPKVNLTRVKSNWSLPLAL